LRSQHVAYLVLAALTVGVLLGLPAGVSARETAGTCQNAALYGQSDDAESWFRLPPYPEGRNAEHIYFGSATVEVEIHDLSTAHNFAIRDLSWGIPRRPVDGRSDVHRHPMLAGSTRNTTRCGVG
jgi:hypothetical protein